VKRSQPMKTRRMLMRKNEMFTRPSHGANPT
jgi:hypothetical protein